MFIVPVYETLYMYIETDKTFNQYFLPQTVL